MRGAWEQRLTECALSWPLTIDHENVAQSLSKAFFLGSESEAVTCSAVQPKHTQEGRTYQMEIIDWLCIIRCLGLGPQRDLHSPSIRGRYIILSLLPDSMIGSGGGKAA